MYQQTSRVIEEQSNEDEDEQAYQQNQKQKRSNINGGNRRIAKNKSSELNHINDEESVQEIEQIDQQEEEAEEQDDEQLNSKLFEMYDNMFINFNNFGAIFQQTAHLIGMLIRKNMVLNQRIEDQSEKIDEDQDKLKQSEQVYESMINQLEQKDQQLDELNDENTQLKLQLEQFLLQPRRQAVSVNQAQQQQQQRDILKEREEAVQKNTKQTIKPILQQNQQLNQKKVEKPQEQIQKSKEEQKQLQAAQDHLKKQTQKQFLAGTYETFFDIEKQPNQDHLNAEHDSCSLRDLFSVKNTKKRDFNQMMESSSQVNNELLDGRLAKISSKYEEEKKDEEKWITNKKKKRSYAEDTQLADRFDQLSQAFFNMGAIQGGPSQRRSQIFNRDSIGSSNQSLHQLQIIGSKMQNFQQNEDSVSSTSVINACIRFDAQQAKDNLVQSKLNFVDPKTNKKQEKRFDIQLVEQVSDSLAVDFFALKNDKKDKNIDNRVSGRGNSSNGSGAEKGLNKSSVSTGASSNKAQKSGVKGKQKML